MRRFISLLIEAIKEKKIVGHHFKTDRMDFKADRLQNICLVKLKGNEYKVVLRLVISLCFTKVRQQSQLLMSRICSIPRRKVFLFHK